MAKDVTSFRSLISDIIDDLGSTITITPISITIDNKYGDKTESDGTPVSTKAVPYDYIASRYNFLTVGDLQEGESAFIIKYDESIAVLSSDTRYKVSFGFCGL